MARQDTYADVDAAAGDKVLGRDVSDTTQNAAGSTKELNVESIALTVDAAAMRTHLNVEDGATADQTGAEIKTAYEAEANTNAYTDAEKSKLAAIEAGATADQSDAEIETAYNNQVSVVSQAEAEAGTATTVRRWTAERVKQAIAALASAASNLAGLSDVDTTGVSDGDILAYNGTATEWQPQESNNVSVSANQYGARNTGDTAMEARTDLLAGSGGCMVIDADGTYPLGFATAPGVFQKVRAKTLSGTCDIQIRKNGTAINGFGTAVGVTSTAGNTTSTETVAEDDYFDVVVTNALTLTGLVLTPTVTRTGD